MIISCNPFVFLFAIHHCFFSVNGGCCFSILIDIYFFLGEHCFFVCDVSVCLSSDLSPVNQLLKTNFVVLD